MIMDADFSHHVRPDPSISGRLYPIASLYASTTLRHTLFEPRGLTLNSAAASLNSWSSLSGEARLPFCRFCLSAGDTLCLRVGLISTSGVSGNNKRLI